MNCAGAALLALITCLGSPDPEIRDKTAFERISAELRGGGVDRDTLVQVNAQLLKLVAAPDPLGFQKPFAVLTLAEVARTDRIKPWMADVDRQGLVDTAATYLTTINDYRAFDNKEGFRHGVAHGADLVLQLALNTAITKSQLDRLLAAVAAQVSPKDPGVAYWAGEPDRLARAVLFIAQRRLHSDAEWAAWFEIVVQPSPLESWAKAFSSEAGIKKRHNTRAFLLSMLATAMTTDDPGMKQLVAPARNSLKILQ